MRTQTGRSGSQSQARALDLFGAVIASGQGVSPIASLSRWPVALPWLRVCGGDLRRHWSLNHHGRKISHRIGSLAIIFSPARTINTPLTISAHHSSVPSRRSARSSEPPRFVSVAASDFRSVGARCMSVDEVRPKVNLLGEFTLAIVGAFAMGLPMAVAIIWVCS